jgi:hypothetical protein
MRVELVFKNFDVLYAHFSRGFGNTLKKKERDEGFAQLNARADALKLWYADNTVSTVPRETLASYPTPFAVVATGDKSQTGIVDKPSMQITTTVKLEKLALPLFSTDSILQQLQSHAAASSSPPPPSASSSSSSSSTNSATASASSGIRQFVVIPNKVLFFWEITSSQHKDAMKAGITVLRSLQLHREAKGLITVREGSHGYIVDLPQCKASSTPSSAPVAPPGAYQKVGSSKCSAKHLKVQATASTLATLGSFYYKKNNKQSGLAQNKANRDNFFLYQGTLTHHQFNVIILTLAVESLVTLRSNASPLNEMEDIAYLESYYKQKLDCFEPRVTPALLLLWLRKNRILRGLIDSFQKVMALGKFAVVDVEQTVSSDKFGPEIVAGTFDVVAMTLENFDEIALFELKSTYSEEQERQAAIQAAIYALIIFFTLSEKNPSPTITVDASDTAASSSSSSSSSTSSSSSSTSLVAQNSKPLKLVLLFGVKGNKFPKENKAGSWSDGFSAYVIKEIDAFNVKNAIFLKNVIQAHIYGVDPSNALWKSRLQATTVGIKCCGPYLPNANEYIHSVKVQRQHLERNVRNSIVAKSKGDFIATCNNLSALSNTATNKVCVIRETFYSAAKLQTNQTVLGLKLAKALMCLRSKILSKSMQQLVKSDYGTEFRPLLYDCPIDEIEVRLHEEWLTSFFEICTHGATKLASNTTAKLETQVPLKRILLKYRLFKDGKVISLPNASTGSVGSMDTLKTFRQKSSSGCFEWTCSGQTPFHVLLLFLNKGSDGKYFEKSPLFEVSSTDTSMYSSTINMAIHLGTMSIINKSPASASGAASGAATSTSASAPATSYSASVTRTSASATSTSDAGAGDANANIEMDYAKILLAILQ